MLVFKLQSEKTKIPLVVSKVPFQLLEEKSPERMVPGREDMFSALNDNVNKYLVT